MSIQSVELVRFISNIPVLSDGTIPINYTESTSPFESDLYTPSFSLSVLARMTQNHIKNGKIKLTSISLGEHTITKKILNSDLSSYAPDMYLMARVVVLESFALIYHIENDRRNLQYVTDKDIKRTKTNISYLADYFSTEDKYRHLIEPLRDMYVALGYMEHQIDVIMNERGAR